MLNLPASCFSAALLEYVRAIFGRSPMPVYDYRCKDCRKSFEKVLTLAEYDKQKVKCPKCGGKNVVQEFKSFFAVTSKKS
jgi:putative FmdB family regulatory protein